MVGGHPVGEAAAELIALVEQVRDGAGGEQEIGDHNHAGLVATAMRVVNAIPAVVAAAPGIRTTLDLPLVTGKGLYGP